MSEKQQKDKRILKFNGITGRWFFGSFLWMVVILVIAVIAILYFLRDNYYSSVRQKLEEEIKTTVLALPSADDLSTAEKYEAVVSIIEDFVKKEKYELMLVDSAGHVVATSSGFSYANEDPVSDFLSASEATNGRSSSVSNTVNGTKILSVTYMLPSAYNNIWAVRIESSIENVDRQINALGRILFVISILILAFSLFSGSYFIRSIVLPIQRVQASAKKIAEGDFTERLESRYDDEIGGLCESINDMADGLSATDKMKNEFITSVSHELRTPLTSIKGWAETLSNTSPGDEQTLQQGMRVLISETDRLSMLVEDLLDFSRLENGTLSINKAPVDLIAELSDAVMMIEQRALQLGINIDYAEPDEMVPIYADKNRVKQIFVNILDNAVKYSKAGDTISVLPRLREREVAVTVQDTGLGIPKEDLPNLTNRFYKAKNASTGSGIGLAVVDEILKAHDGSIAFESELGQGTAVTVTFPLLQ